MNKTALADRELSAKRFRETFGLYYEDFEIGDVFEHRPGRTITDEHRPGNTITDVDNILVTLLTMNIQPVFFDEAYATSTEWKKRLIDSTLTVALLTAMSVRTVGANVVANLGWDKIKATHPRLATTLALTVRTLMPVSSARVNLTDRLLLVPSGQSGLEQPFARPERPSRLGRLMYGQEVIL